MACCTRASLGVQLTWMDAKVGDWVVTPRLGKPVEVNALWLNALATQAKFARALGGSAAPLRPDSDSSSTPRRPEDILPDCGALPPATELGSAVFRSGQTKALREFLARECSAIAKCGGTGSRAELRTRS